MTSRHKSREIALQVLFAWDATGVDDDVTAIRIAEDASADVDVRLHGIELAHATWSQREMLDTRIEKLAPQWPPRRQPAVDRTILRLAACELLAAVTPPKVVIDEAIELAKHFSTENSPSFVNGVLDALLKEHRGIQESGIRDQESDQTPVTTEPLPPNPEP